MDNLKKYNLISLILIILFASHIAFFLFMPYINYGGMLYFIISLAICILLIAYTIYSTKASTQSGWINSSYRVNILTASITLIAWISLIGYTIICHIRDLGECSITYLTYTYMISIVIGIFLLIGFVLFLIGAIKKIISLK